MNLIKSVSIFLILYISISCEEKQEPPVELATVNTGEVTNITASGAEISNTVEFDGGGEVTARGVSWSTLADPVITDNKTSDGAGEGRFESKLSGLLTNTTYYVRAYATNNRGTAYGEMRSFQTLDNSAIASFQYTISESNYLEVSFVNFSENAVSYEWNFGDDGNSIEENPTHTYNGPGTYTVTLVVKNSDSKESAPYKIDLTITDPNAGLKLLTGDVSKDWKLYREGLALEIGPNEELPNGWFSLENDGTRPCSYDDTWTFYFDGTMEFDDGKSMWGELDIWGSNPSENPLYETCFVPNAANMTIDGNDVSAWGSRTHSFDYDVEVGQLTLNGTGAWMVIPNLGTDASHAVNAFPLSKTVPISIQEFDGYDLLTVTFDYSEIFYRATYVSYANWSDEPASVSFSVGFDVAINGRECTFTNTSVDALSYNWDFGDGTSSTEASPVHTYGADDTYTVVLTATGTGTNMGTAEKVLFIDTAAPTEAAPIPTEDAANVISIYSDAYTDITGVNLNPDWGQATVTTEEVVAGDNVLKMARLNFQGIDWAGSPLDVSSKTKVHVDAWSKDVITINFVLISAGNETPVAITTAAGAWQGFDIDLSNYVPPVDLSATIRFKFDDDGSGSAPTFYVDNMYFY